VDLNSGAWQQVNDKWGLIDKKDNSLIKPISDTPIFFAEDLALYKSKNKFGYIDRRGNIVVDPKYDTATIFSSGHAFVSIDGLAGYINTKGEFIFNPQFENAYLFDENGIALVELGHEKGFIDKDENWKIKLKPNQNCSIVSEFHDGMSLINNKGIDNFGFINKNGELVYEQEEGDKIPRHFSEGLAQIEKNGKWGYIDKTGKVVIKPQFEYAAQFSEGLAKIKTKEGWSYIDNTGSVIIEPKFKSASEFSEWLAWVYANNINGGGYINKSGEFIIGLQIKDPNILSAINDPIKAQKRCKNYKDRDNCIKERNFTSGRDFSEGLAAVCYHGKCGYINRSGEKAIDFKFSRALSFSEGLARVTTDEKWGYIDKTGEIVIEEAFDFARDFNSGVAMVKVGKEYGYINQKGEWIVEPQDQPSLGYKEGFIPFYTGAELITAKYGYLNNKGNFGIQPKYKIASRFSEGLACVTTWGKSGYINTKGEWIWKPTR